VDSDDMEGRGASHSVSTKIVLWRQKDEMSSKLQSPSNAINTTLGWVRLVGLADVWSRSWFPAQGRTCYLATSVGPGPGNVVFFVPFFFPLTTEESAAPTPQQHIHRCADSSDRYRYLIYAHHPTALPYNRPLLPPYDPLLISLL
jgi:hypothetical protein